MIDHLFECVVDSVPEAVEFAVDVVVAMVETDMHDGSFHNLLEGSTEQPMQDVSVMSVQTREEVLAAHDAGAARRSQRQGHEIYSICVQRRDSGARKPASVARLVVVDLGGLPDGS